MASDGRLLFAKTFVYGALLIAFGLGVAAIWTADGQDTSTALGATAGLTVAGLFLTAFAVGMLSLFVDD